MPNEPTAKQWAGYLRAMASERRRIGDPSYVGLTAGELDQAANEMDRLRADNKLLARSLGIGWSGPVADAITRSMQDV